MKKNYLLTWCLFLCTIISMYSKTEKPKDEEALISLCNTEEEIHGTYIRDLKEKINNRLDQVDNSKKVLSKNLASCVAPSNIMSADAQKTTIFITWDAIGTETMWDVAIKLGEDVIFDIDESEINTISTTSHTFTSLTEDVEYRVYFRANCGAGDVSEWKTGFFTTTADCPRPRNLMSTSTSTSTADISWTPKGVETSWEVVISEQGQGEPTAPGVIVTSPNYQVTGINITTIFEYYVRAICSPTEKSAWSKKVITEELQSERDILMALYNSTDGPNWSNNTNWGTDNPLDTWHGIKTSEGRVNFLNLWSNGLSGEFPDMITDLTELHTLNLGANSISGEISASINKLSKLTILDLGFNSLTGAIPSSIGSLTELTSLKLWHNNIVGSIPVTIGDLTNLQILFLESANAITIPASFSNLQELTQLRLDSCGLTGMIPEDIFYLPKLSQVSLIDNQFQGGIPQQALNSEVLESLRLEKNQLSGTIPTTFSNTSKINYLELSNNQFTGAIPKELGNLSLLRYLYLDNNQLQGEIPVELEQARLITLDVSNNNLSGTIPAELADINTIQNLDIGDNNYNFDNLEKFHEISPMTLSVDYAPQTLEVQETTLNKSTGDHVILTSTIEGINNSYQWYRDGLAITEGGMGKTYEIPNIALENTGTYHCVVSNSVFTGFTLMNERIIVNVVVLDDDMDGVDDNIDACLGTDMGALVDENGCEIFALPPDTFRIQITGESCRTSENGSVMIVSANKDYTFKAVLTGNEVSKEVDFKEQTSIEDLSAGTYELCLTLTDEPSFKQCFTIVIEEPENLAVYSKVDSKAKKVLLDLSGSYLYHIEVNDLKFSTEETTLSLFLDKNMNSIKVSTDKGCQGIFEKTIYLSEEISVSPSPFLNILHINTGIESKETSINLYSLAGTLVYSRSYAPLGNEVTIDTSSLPSGTYILSVTTTTTQNNLKIIKR